MSAAELMTEIGSLPPNERHELCGWLQKNLENEAPDVTEAVGFEKAMKRVFQKHDVLLRKLSQ
jgi:hypothetical protein